MGEVGSSPRAWGLRSQLIAKRGENRFIPTCVGTTFTPNIARADEIGSSPRAWGLHFFSTAFDAVYPRQVFLARLSLVKDLFAHLFS